MRKRDLQSSGRFRIAAAASISALLLAQGASSAFAADATPAATPSASPTATHSASPSATPIISSAPMKKPHLTPEQKNSLAAALATYKATIQSALDGANKAIADARSIRDQALAAAPQDKNVKALANSDFKNNSAQIWSAFRSSVAKAKANYDATVTAIKEAATK